jgi:hypothetical protein
MFTFWPNRISEYSPWLLISATLYNTKIVISMLNCYCREHLIFVMLFVALTSRNEYKIKILRYKNNLPLLNWCAWTATYNECSVLSTNRDVSATKSITKIKLMKSQLVTSYTLKHDVNRCFWNPAWSKCKHVNKPVGSFINNRAPTVMSVPQKA